MQKSILAATLAASLLALGAPKTARAQFIAPLGTGYMGANSLQYNNPTSALMSTMIQNNMNSMMFRNMTMGQHYRRYGYGGGRSGPTPAQLQERRGRALIKRGRATTTFKLRPINSVQLVNEWAKKNDNGRAGALEEWRGQSAIWREAVAARQERGGDRAHIDALAFVMCLEAYTGRQLSNAAFQRLAKDFRGFYLKNAYYQGETLVQKQSDYESSLLSASWAIYLRRHGREEEARKVAATWLDDQ